MVDAFYCNEAGRFRLWPCLPDQWDAAMLPCHCCYENADQQKALSALLRYCCDATQASLVAKKKSDRMDRKT